MSNQTLLQLAESFRARATAVEAKHRKDSWTQTINVIEAFEQCAGDLEAYAKTLDAPVLPIAQTSTSTTNPS